MARSFELLPKEFVSRTGTFDYKTPIGEILSQVKEFGAVVITKRGKYFGLLDDRGIAAKGTLKVSPKYPAGKFTKRVPMLAKGSSVEQAIEALYSYSVKALPYADGDSISGIVKRDVMLRAILSLHMLSQYKVGDAMSSPVIAISDQANVAQAKTTMERFKVSKIIVLDKEKKPIGILSYNDIISNFARVNTRAQNLYDSKENPTTKSKVIDLAVTNIHQITADKSVEDAIRTLVEKNLSSLLVLRDGKPSGIITVRDVFELVVSSWKAQRSHLMLSGLDERQKEYEGEMVDMLEDLAERVNKFGSLQIDRIAVHVKKFKARNYELSGKVTLKNGYSAIAAMSGFSLMETLKDLCNRLYEDVKERKEILLTERKEEMVR